MVNNQDEEAQQQAEAPSTPQSKPFNNFRKLYRAVLSTPGKLVIKPQPSEQKKASLKRKLEG